MEILVSRQCTRLAIYHVYRDLYLSRVWSSYFPSGYTACSFSTFLFFFFYMGRNDAVERYAKISHVSLERCILWNDDKMINLCSLMRCFSYDASVMHFTMPALFILKSGDNKLPCATWQILKIGKSLSALLMNSFQRTENYNENLSVVL